MSSKDKKKTKKDKKGKADKFVLGNPTGFRHVAHVGFDPSKGALEVKSVIQTLMEIFETSIFWISLINSYNSHKLSLFFVFLGNEHS
jgi:hypothetical protein